MGELPRRIVGRHPSGWTIEVVEVARAQAAPGWRYAARDPAGSPVALRLWGAPFARTLATAKRHAVGETRIRMHERLVSQAIMYKSWRWSTEAAPGERPQATSATPAPRASPPPPSRPHSPCPPR